MVESEDFIIVLTTFWLAVDLYRVGTLVNKNVLWGVTLGNFIPKNVSSSDLFSKH